MIETKRQKNERLIWDQNASSYDANVMATYEEAYRLTVEAILEEVNPTSIVLEIGCGTGIIAIEIAPEVDEITGVDISPEMIVRAQEKSLQLNLDNVDFQVGDGYDLPFEKGSFDVVLLPNLLHIVADPAAILKEAHRLLKPGGVLITVTDCMAEPVPFRIRMNLLIPRLLKLFGMIKYFSYFHKSDLKSLLQENGFTIEKEADFHSAPVNYYLTGKRN